jgi:hypothetical protein
LRLLPLDVTTSMPKLQNLILDCPTHPNDLKLFSKRFPRITFPETGGSEVELEEGYDSDVQTNIN